MWFTLGFAVASVLGTYWYQSWMIWLIPAAMVLSLIALLLRNKWKKPRIFAALLLGISLGVGWYALYDAVYLSEARGLDGQTVSVTVQVTDYSYETDYGSAVQTRVYLDGKPYQALFYLDGEVELKPGDEIKGGFRFRLTHDGMRDDTHHRGKGVFLLAYQSGQVLIGRADEIPGGYFPAKLRMEIAALLDEVFSEDTAFFTKALLLGDRSGVDYETNTAFKVSGISHIIAVSGLHVSILFSLVEILSGKKRLLTALIGIPVLILFAAVAGFTPSITRACLMQILMILAQLLNREYDPPTALSFAALAMMIGNPIVVTSASFQLSVGCMAGIFLFSEKIQSWIQNFPFWRDWKGKGLRVRLRQWFAAGLAVTLSSMFFTTPLVAYYFGAVSLIGVITNLLTLWAVTWIFYGIMAVCLLSLIWMKGAAALAWCISWLIRYVLQIAHGLASFPLAAVYTKSIYIVAWLALCYVLVICFLIFRKRQPMVLICCSVIGLCTALCCSWMEPLMGDCRMTMLDVGQGQCVILQADGKTFLVDCGGDSDTQSADIAAETLLSMGICRLDGLIVTHYDGDHAGGVGYLLSRIPADVVYLPETEDEEALGSILTSASDYVHFVTEDTELSWGDTNLTVFAPVLSSSDNESGLCVLFREKNCDILITGDLSTLGEFLLLYEKDIPELTALVVGHHGSKSSTSDALLSHTRPEYAFISVGERNAYGHPSKEVLERLQEAGCIVYRTDLNGTIVFKP